MEETKFWLIPLVVLIVLTAAVMWIYPTYNVWASELKGKAEFVQAEQNRKIKIQEAQALKESAKFLSEAEIIRAQGVAEANKIIGQSLNDNEAYLRYLWVNGLNEKDDVTTIYIPTEGQMPLMKPVK